MVDVAVAMLPVASRAVATTVCAPGAMATLLYADVAAAKQPARVVVTYASGSACPCHVTSCCTMASLASHQSTLSWEMGELVTVAPLAGVIAIVGDAEAYVAVMLDRSSSAYAMSLTLSVVAVRTTSDTVFVVGDVDVKNG